MKYFIFLTFLLFPFLSFGQTTLTIVSGDTLEIIIFQDSKMIHHHIMNPGDELTLDKSKPVLIQFRVVNYHPIDSPLDWVKINKYGFFEIYFDYDLDMRLTKEYGHWYDVSMKQITIPRWERSKKVIPRA